MAGEVKKLQFSEGTSVGNPTDLSLATSTSHFKTFANDAAYLADKGSGVAEGDIYVNTTLGTVRFYEGGAWKNGLLSADPTDPTKLWLVDLSGATTGTATTIRFLQTANRQIDMPDAAGEILLATNTKDVTNKTLIDSSTEIKSSTGTNRKVGFDASGATNTTKTTIRANQTANRNIDLPDASDTLVGKATVDVLTNKDFDGGTASNTKRITVPKDTLANLLALTRKEGTILYGTDTDVFYADDGTNLKPVGAGGAGEINLIQNPNDVNSGWAVTGSGPTAANTTTAGDLPLNSAVGITSAIKLTSAATAQTEASNYQGYAFTTPVTMGRKLKVEVWMRPGTNFISNEWTVSIYAGATRQPLSTDVSGVSYLSNINGKFVTTFDALASTAYTIRFARPVNAGLNAGVLNVNGIVVGPGIQAGGPIVSKWTSYTPTWTGLGTSTYTQGAVYRRVGDTLEVKGYIKFSALAGGSGTLTASLPTGLTMSSSSLPYASFADSRNKLGSYVPYNVIAASTDRDVSVVPATSTTIQMLLATAAANTFLAYGNLAATSELDYAFNVPITEWADGGVLNLLDTSFVNQNARVRYYPGSTHSPTANTAINFNTESTLVAKVGTWSNSSGEITAPAPGTYRVTYVVDFASAAAGYTPYVALGGVSKIKGAFKGTGETPEGTCIISITNPSTETISLRATANLTSVQGVDAQAWISIERVADYTAQAVGFGAATSTAAGLVSTSNQILGGRKTAGNSKVNVTLSGAQSIANATTTKIQFNTEAADTNSEFDNATNYRFTPTNAGYYLAVINVEFASAGDGKGLQTFLRKNGSTVEQFYTDIKVGNTGGITLNVAGIFSLNGTTDYLEAYCEQNSGGALNISGGTSATRMIISELL